MSPRRAGAQRRGHSRYDFKLQACVGQRLRLFAPASEDERIAPFQAHHIQSAPAALHKEFADLFLGERVIRFFLADVNAFSRSGREAEQFHAGEMIVQDHVCVLKNPLPFESD